MRTPSFAALGLGLLLLATPWSARADPITPWPGVRTETGTLQLVPLLYVAGDASSAYPSLYASTGIGDSWDLYVGLWGSASREGPAFDLLDVFPRYHLGEETALVLRLMASPGNDFVLGGELHTNQSWGDLSLMINTGVRPQFEWGTNRLRTAILFAMLAPEYHFSQRFSVYMEFNPAVSAEEPFSEERSMGAELALLPGICFSLDEAQNHQFSVGAELALRRGEAVSLARSVTFAAWYATSFDLGGGAKDDASARAPGAINSRRLGQRGALTAWNR